MSDPGNTLRVHGGGSSSCSSLGTLARGFHAPAHSACEGAKSASCYRLKKTWNNVRDRQAREDQRFQYKPTSMAIEDDDSHHGQGLGDHLLNGEMDAEDSALLIFEQRRKFKATKKNMKGMYDQMEDTLVDGRNAPVLRTTAGEVLRGVYPPKSFKWLGVAPRFGSTVPQEKYVGTQANELSKWISTDKVTRLQQERSIHDQPVRAYLRMDDSIDVQKMTGSHMKFIVNPLEEPESEYSEDYPEGTLPPGPMARFALEDGQEGWPSGSVEEEDEWGDDWEYEDEDDEKDEAKKKTSGEMVAARNSLMDFDAKFQRHLNKLSDGIQQDMRTTIGKLESGWRNGMAERSATLRYRR